MSDVWTVLDVLQWSRGWLQQKGIDTARLDAELLLAAALHLDRVGLYLNYDRPLSAEERQRYRQLLRRRGSREPVAYILEETEFWSCPLRVTPDVLIPRPETEGLVEMVLELQLQPQTVLDVGTGSGALLVAMGCELSDAALAGVDVSDAALQVARHNLQRHQLLERCHLYQGDFTTLPATGWDLVVSNPPYIATAELAQLMPEVRDYEPQPALDGGTDGLEVVRRLIPWAAHCLHEQGWLLLEVGAQQAQQVQQLCVQQGLQQVQQRLDLAGHARVVAAQRG